MWRDATALPACLPLRRPGTTTGIDPVGSTTTRGFRRTLGGSDMNSLKDVCTVIPAVLLTGVAVVGVATVMSLASWSLL